MNDLNLLKILLQEKKYPYFSDEELTTLLAANNNNVYLTASSLCVMKADNDKEITVGPITIKGPGADYWTNLSTQYSAIASRTSSSNGSTTNGYKCRMNRMDDI
ncbi:hypothetical protein [Clostridium sp. HBUAS56017]|uniref:hypothetical protein n=1 Tax=Clostridium sp. HBUAS56017 TaxID=2571128 RepID=UPI001177A950|nr:hypothetical protein [Clostridium sp. HBUAS56017]